MEELTEKYEDEEYDELTTYTRALAVLDNDGVRIDNKAKCFIVVGTAENRLVTLFPK